MDKSKPYTGYNKELKERARMLRKNMTPEESRLWYAFLKDYPVKVYRQRVIDGYIVDFYCSSAKLVIEIDGTQHYTTEGVEYDSIRSELLEQYGLEVIRFTNLDIHSRFCSVCDKIHTMIQHRMKKIHAQENSGPNVKPETVP
ncbi:MAG: endonuclease domain-containing protein [Clostridiales bacterium]|nr:endonuclease domain-containing protein [Clostridiales bacterium]